MHLKTSSAPVSRTMEQHASRLTFGVYARAVKATRTHVHKPKSELHVIVTAFVARVWATNVNLLAG